MARNITTVVIGAGHAGLAMSHRLSARSIDHVVLERGEVANTWKTERWDSLRLLTPNWQSRLPGFRYDGDDPDGFMTMPEVISFIERYADVVDAPVHTGTTVTERAAGVGRVRRHDQRGVVERLDGRAGDRGLQRRPCPRVRRRRPGGHRRGDAGRVPEPGPARRRRRAGGRSVGDGHPARRRDPPLGPPGHDGRRRARARPAHRTGDGTSSAGWTTPA